MATTCPRPEDLGIRVPGHLIEERFRRGFRHALAGGQLSAVEHLRLSFREGFRAGKLCLRALRRSRGLLDFPMRGRIRVRARF